MKKRYSIALDAMGGDDGIDVVVPAALLALEKHPNLSLILVGNESDIHQALSDNKIPDHFSDRITIEHAPEVVSMDELPSVALRGKKKSSMRLAINLVKNGDAQACVSAGNTGALMVTARFVLRTLPGIDRPAILSELPTTKGTVKVIDLGANVDSTAEQLFQFALMGSAVAEAVDGNPNPSVALLNIGSEEIKGNEQVKATSLKLAQCDAINFIGYIEGDDIFQGHAEVVVCDGFVGNVALKTTEGVAKLLGHYIKQSFRSSIYGKFIAFLALPIIKKLKKKLDPTRYNGASFVGLNGIVVKSHGSTTVKGFCYAIEEAMREVKNDVPRLIRDRISKILTEGVDA